jgi:hypothetical protein
MRYESMHWVVITNFKQQKLKFTIVSRRALLASDSRCQWERPWSLIFSTADIWGWILLCSEQHLYSAGCLISSLAFK